MKILVLSNMYPSSNNPTFGVFVKNFYEYLRDNNGRRNTYLSVMKGQSKSGLIKLFDYVSYYIKTILLLLFRNYDLVYVHTVTYPVLPVKIVSYFKEIPLAFNIHGSDWITHSGLSARLKKMALPLVEKAKLIVVPSSVFRDLVIDELPNVDKNKIIVSYSAGIDLGRFTPSEKNSTDKEGLTIGYVSRIIENKGWRVFIEALKQLKDGGYAIKAIMAGGGEQEAEMLSMIKKYDLDNDIEYFGAVAQENLPELYRKMDLFVFPTLFFESLGLVGVEALACGVPVIGTNQGGPTEYIKEGENGYLFKKGDVYDLCSKITDYLSLLNNEKIMMRSNAVKSAMIFDKDIVMKCLISHIKNFCNSK